MLNFMNKFLIIFILFFSHFAANAQDVDKLKSALQSAGFEQVIVLPVSLLDDGRLYLIGIEHRGINNPAEVLILANSISTSMGFLHTKFTLFYKGQVIHQSEFNNGTIVSSNLSDTYSRDFYQKFSPRNYRLNTFIDPEIQIRFGNFINPIQSKTSLFIGSDIVLARGFSLFTGIAIPIQNDLDSESNNVKLGSSYFDYFTQFLTNHYAQLSAGMFYDDRYGVDLEYRYFPNHANLSVGLRYAKTGFYYFPENAVFFESKFENLYLINFEYLFPKDRINVSLEFGQFLNKDTGLKLLFIKQYKNIEVGFFSTVTQTGRTAGFNFMVPLIPGKIIRTRNFEFRTNDSFRWEYSYSNEGEIGRDFNAKKSLRNTLRRFNSNLYNRY